MKRIGIIKHKWIRDSIIEEFETDMKIDQYFKNILRFISEKEINIESVIVSFNSDWDNPIAKKEYDEVDEFVEDIKNIMAEDIDYILFNSSVNNEKLDVRFYFIDHNGKYRVLYKEVKADISGILEKHFEYEQLDTPKS